jgi:hypothetical protein
VAQLLFVNPKGRELTMVGHTRAVLAAVGAALVLATAVGSASAGRLSISNKGIRIVSSGIEFIFEEGEALGIACPITLEGSFHSATIRKVPAALIGHITRATTSTRTCGGGTITTLQTSLPWHVRYRGFTGRLPRLSGMTLGFINAGFLIGSLAYNCLYLSTEANPLVGELFIEPNGLITSLGWDTNFAIPLREDLGIGLCPPLARPVGSGMVMLLGTNNRISIRLI